jgi:hypothetical protein
MDHHVETGWLPPDGATICYVDCMNGVRLRGQLRRRLWRTRPAFHFPARGLKQIGRRGADITAAGNQDAWHQLTTGTISISSNSSG